MMQGQSWSIGGDPGAQTVATFLRFYTPNIVGASLGKHFVEVRLFFTYFVKLVTYLCAVSILL